MVCLYCNGKTEVINSRAQKRNNQVWRRRKCLKCKAVFTSHEVVELESALYVDKAGTPTPFLPDLLFTEMLLALGDHKKPYLAAREATKTVIQRLLKLPNKPFFTPQQISLAGGEVLSKLDRRAHLRFVSEHPSLQG